MLISSLINLLLKMSSPSFYWSLFITIALVIFTDAYKLGRIKHPHEFKLKLTTEMRNASRYCGNGFFLYLTKLVDITDPNEEELWTTEYVRRICTSQVVDDVIRVNQTKYIYSMNANITWGADFKMNDTHYYLVSEYFEQRDEADANDSETAKVKVERKHKSTTMDPASLMSLRQHFIKCTSENCPLSDDVAMPYNAILGYDSGEIRQQFTLNKNALLDENFHLVSKYHFNYDEHGPAVLPDGDITPRSFCPPGCVPEKKVIKTIVVQSLKLKESPELPFNRANVVSPILYFITMSLLIVVYS